MRTLALVRFALSACVVAGLVSGCGGSQPPIGVQDAIPQIRAVATHTQRGGSWMLPEAKTAAQLLYVADYESNQVSVVELPQGKLVGQLDGFDAPFGECTDSAGDVFVTDLEAAQIWEYAHGAKSPKNILNDTGYYPGGCSVDPKTGNLAVTNEIGETGPGNIAIFTQASGKPTFYFDSSIEQFGFCAYDDAGNLYAGGATSASDSFAELLKGKDELTALTLDEDVSGTSPMQWDGEDLAILDGIPGSLIYRFKISGSTGTAVGILRLRKASEVLGFWIQGGTLYAPLFNENEVGEYAYPRGGKIIKTFFGFGEPVSAAVSTLR
jgi:hypothetical protein